MGKKLNRSEIETIAKRILQDVNEVNKDYNEKVKTSKTYLDKIEEIKSKDVLYKASKEIEKQITIQLGSNWQSDANFSLNPNTKYGVPNKYYKIQKEVEQEIKDYNKTQFKEIYSIPQDSYGKQNNLTYQKIVDDITIGQIDMSDVQMLINTIKSKLL